MKISNGQIEDALKACPLTTSKTSYEITESLNATLNMLGIEKTVIDAQHEKDEYLINVITRIVELATTGDPSHTALHLFNLYLVDLDWIIGVVQRDKIGCPSTVALHLLQYHAGDHQAITKSWFERIAKKAVSGEPMCCAVIYAVKYNKLSWARDFIENYNSPDKLKAAAMLMNRNILSTTTSTTMYDNSVIEHIVKYKVADPSINHDWLNNILKYYYRVEHFTGGTDSG